MEEKRSFYDRWRYMFLLSLMLVGCAGTQRYCSSCTAGNFGADWVVVQLDLNGQPFRCWTLEDTSISNGEQSDGIYWLDGESGNLVHISGLYNRVQVENNNWSHAYEELGLSEETCRAIRDQRYQVPNTPAP